MSPQLLESPFDVSEEATGRDLYESEFDVAIVDQTESDLAGGVTFEDTELLASEVEPGGLESLMEAESPTTTPSLDDFVAVALSQRGDPYVFGAEASVNDPNPPAFDCSELVEWAASRAGVRFVDGAQNQRDTCQRAGTLIPVEVGLRTRGALLFRIDEGPGNDHVAISLGDGTTMEAKGSSYGVNVFSAAHRRWTHAGVIPGFGYTPGSGSSTPPPPVPIGTRTLRQGSRGEDVRALQRALQMRGFDPGPADGIFGSRSDSAVRAFQKSFGLQVDGVVGPQTHAALSSGVSSTASSATTSSGSSTSGPTTDLGELVFAATGRSEFRYRFTSDDLIWTAKLLVYEAGGQDDVDNAAVLWAMFNRYALFTHTVFSTFTDYIRAYSTTLQPVLKSAGAAERHYKKGDAVYKQTGGIYPGTQIPKGQLVRHLQIQAAPWSAVKESARNLATRALRGELPNPGIGLASEFASTHIYFKQRFNREPNDQEFLEFTRALARKKKWEFVETVPELNPKKNAFFLDNRAKGLPSSAVRVEPPSQGREMEAEFDEELFGFESGAEEFEAAGAWVNS